MSSIKCAACGLVNFSTAMQCKRCAQPLSEMAAFAEQRTYQQNPQPTAPQNNFQQFQSFQAPPPPPVFHGHSPAFNQPQQAPQNFCCIKCGSRSGVSMYRFNKTYLTPVAYLGILIGPLIFLILALALRVKHRLNAPLCAQCWNGLKNLPTISTLLNLACIAAIFGGVTASFVIESAAFGFLAVIVGVGIGIFAKVYETKVSPKYKKVNRELVVISAPTIGDVTFYR